MNYAPVRRISVLRYGEALSSEIRDPGRFGVFGSGGRSGSHVRANALGPCIVVGRKGSFGTVWWSDDSAFVIDTAYFIDRTCTDQNMRWLYYALGTIGLGETSSDVGIPGLSRDVAYGLTLPVLPTEEQRRIADFLDDQVARIDNIIAARRAQALLLRQADDTQIDSELRMMRERYPDVRLSYLAKISSGDFLPASKFAAGGTFPVYGGNGECGMHDSYNFEIPTVVVGRVGALCGNVHRTTGPSWITDNAIAIEPRRIGSEFLTLV